MKKTVLFLCTHNSARSQMAEGLLNGLHGDGFEASSAGTEETRVNPFATQALAEMGIDISHHFSKTVDHFKGREFDYVVTVCDNAKETCPFFPGKEVIHHSFEDPSQEGGDDAAKLNAFIRIRDQIRSWIDEDLTKR